MDGYETSVRLHVTPRLGDIGLTDLTATLLEDWLDDLADDGLGPRGWQKALRALSVALSVAVKRDLIGRYPTRSVEGPRVVAKRVKAWTRAQAGAFISVAAEAPHLNGTCGWPSSGPAYGRQRRSRSTSRMSISTVLARVHRNLSWRKAAGGPSRPPRAKTTSGSPPRTSP